MLDSNKKSWGLRVKDETNKAVQKSVQIYWNFSSDLWNLKTRPETKFCLSSSLWALVWYLTNSTEGAAYKDHG